MFCLRLMTSLLMLAGLALTGYARISPANGAALNYNQVMFEYDEVKGADYYIITISPAATTGASKQTAIQKKNYSLAFIQQTGLHFGQHYIWRYEAFKQDKSIFKSEEFSFQIKASFQTSESWLRSVIETNDTTRFKEGIIFLDYMGMAINRKGEPVWYLPLEKDSLENLKMRNVKMTAAGTITYLDNRDCFEKDINAAIVWKAPNNGAVSGDKQEYYHHDFFKNDDGTYIAAGYKFINEPNFYDKNILCKVRYNTLIQYNREGKVLWYWDESAHADKKSLYGDSGPTATEVTGTHMNGVAYYKPDDAFICSFRDNSSILKISKKTGKILYNLGDSLKKYYPDEIPFASQHGPSLLKDGSIVVYNNNLNRTAKTKGPTYPIIKIFSQPSANKQSQKLWDYECYSEKYPDGIFGKEGYASQLPYNNNLLICMGGANFIFEITPDRKIAWQCVLQQYNESSKEWTAVNNYRCSYASSLFPVYFTLQHAKQVADANGIQLRINNEGSEACTYIIEVNGVNNNSPVTIHVGGNKDLLINRPSGRNPEKSGTTVTVYPENNPNLKREIHLED